MNNLVRPVLVPVQLIRSTLFIILCAVTACGGDGDATGPEVPPQSGDAGPPLDGATPDVPSPPPETTITAPPAGATTAATVSVEFNAPGSGIHFECRLDAEPASACSSPKLYTNLTDGVHTVFVRALTADNVAGPEASRSFTVDTHVPIVTVNGLPARDSVTNMTTTALTFTADLAAATITCQIDGRGPAPCTSPLNLSGLGDGSHVVTFQATVGAHIGPSVIWTWTVDTVAPTALLTGPLTAGHPVRERLPTLTGTTEAGIAVSIHIISNCGAPVAGTGIAAPDGTFAVKITETVPAAADGPTAYYVRSSDVAGNVGCFGPFSYFTDNTPPAVAVQSPTTPSTPSRERRPTLTGTAEASAAVRIFRGAGCAGPATAPVTSTGTWSIAIDAATEAAPDGVTAYSAQATDAAGNAGCADFAYHTDTTPPAVTVQSLNTPSTPSQDRRPTLTGTAEDSATVRVFRGAGCTGPSTAPVTSTGAWSIAIDAATEAAPDGMTAYSAQATDAAGNAGCAGVAYFTDTIPPAVAITAPVTDAQHGLRSRRPVLSGTAETGATIQVFRGDACTGPATTTTIAAQGAWSIATDPTTDTPADGPTIYTARATDAVGNAACSAAFTYFSDNTPPETTITSPAVPTSTNEVDRTFRFTSNEPSAHFECASGSAAFAPCTSPADSSVPFNTRGPVQFQVRAIDFAGNVDASPATFTWTSTQAPMIQYAFEGDGANTGALALDATPDYTGSVQNADFVPGRFGKALAFRMSPSSKFVAPIKNVVRRAPLFAIAFWFREDTVRASVGDAALFDNGTIRIFHATSGSELTLCGRTGCKTFTYSVGDWHNLRIEFSTLEVILYIDDVRVTSILAGPLEFVSSTDIELGRGTSFMVDDLRFYDVETLSEFLGVLSECQPLAIYDRNGSCLNRFTPPLPRAFEFEQTGATHFAPGRVDVYSAQLTGPAIGASVNAGTATSYWLGVDASQSSFGDVFTTSGVRHSLSGTRHFVTLAGQDIALPALAAGWHHFLYSIEAAPHSAVLAKLFVDGMLMGQVTTAFNPLTGTATIGGGPIAYIDSLRAYDVPIDPQTVCQLGPAGNWLFSTQTCRLSDDPAIGLCVDAAAGSDSAVGDCAHPFATITRALAAAAVGQPILVRPGTYDAAHGEVFPLVVGQRTAVIGDEAMRGVNPAAPTRIAGCAADPAGQGDDVAVVLAGPRSSISGFDLGCPTRGRAIVVDADGATVRRVHVAQAHIAVAHGAVIDTVILGNELVDSDTAIAFSGEPRIEANRITNNGIGLLQQDTSVLDAGGGPRASRGGNQLYCNTILDVSSGASILHLRNNAWDETPPLVATVPTGCAGLRTDICLLTPNASIDTGGATLAPAPRCELD